MRFSLFLFCLYLAFLVAICAEVVGWALGWLALDQTLVAMASTGAATVLIAAVALLTSLRRMRRDS